MLTATTIPSITIYIDEAGDPGVRDGLRYAAGRHEWLCLAAIAVRTSRASELVDWVKELRLAARSTQAGALHYHRINRQRRVDVCMALAKKPCKAFVLASHKSNMREYVNLRIGAMLEGAKFYNWCLRLLLERATAWAEGWQRAELGRIEPLQILLARRGHDYDHFFAYVDLLRMQSEAGTLFLKGPGLAPQLLDRGHWRVEAADRLAGLQLADTIASAFYQAANIASPAWDVSPAEALAPIVARKGNCAANYGVTVFPLPHQATLPEESRAVFRSYGYKF